MTATRALPSGRHTLTPDQVAESQRQRLYSAVVAVAAERGWNATRIADVVARAGVSRATFYQHCSGLDDLLAKAFDDITGGFIEELNTALVAPELTTMRQRLDAIFRTYVDRLEAIEGLAKTLHVESVRASEDVMRVRRRTFEMTAAGLGQAYAYSRRTERGLPPRSRTFFAMLLGGLDELFRERILSGEGLDGMAEVAASAVAEALGLDA